MILNNKQVLAVLYVLLANFVRSKRLFGVSSDRTFKRIIPTEIWKIEVTRIRLQERPTYRDIWFCQKWQAKYILRGVGLLQVTCYGISRTVLRHCASVGNERGVPNALYHV